MNGHPVDAGRWGRMRQRLSGRGSGGVPLGVDDADLIVVAESDDETAASSAVLDESAWRPGDDVVLRHILRVPVSRVDDAVATAALDGYERLDDVLGRADGGGIDGTVVVVLGRRQTLDAMHLSQERSRMAGLGARHGGSVLRWQVLQRPQARR
ncbi:hypothetical protein G3I13_15145 [Streptomyces sp. SID6673]|nr:hypothetical protein [Streptomyces sp. SID11726]NEB25675.1 hypothetical protein [Streptomyces sp. SID6673]NED66786.1 hypothetical protein [Streptomyces sp. SID10244]